ncbi:AMP-binding protein [uncultured Williamsia sp.]|uniref:class I adenylate-forming enzyme family protein n=1 Tax=uncultured Williamsia sp. TaxID=259311 RepID=UPI00262A7E72|nr:AMP-binding protein [uncultured Williamsia sp.]
MYWDLLVDAADRTPDAVVLTDDHGRGLTCGELRDLAEATARWLADLGVAPGSTVSWQLPTCLETMVVMTALTRIGAVQNPILPIWRERELAVAMRELSPATVIVPTSWRGVDHVALVESVTDTPAPRIIALDVETPPISSRLRIDLDPDARLDTPCGGTGGDVRWVFYTSGTTSDPKGARHTDDSIIASTTGIVEMVGASSADVNPVAFPVSHIGGASMLAASLRTGMQLVLFDTFDPVATPVAMARHRPTLLGSATPFFHAFVQAQKADPDHRLFPDLRGCVGGGAPVTTALSAQIRRHLGVPGVANAWGLTEFPVAASATPDAPLDVLDHTAGRPVSGVRVRVVGADGLDVDPGHEGELRLRGPQCFQGYVDASLDKAAFDEDGWFCTGDLGRIDADGNVVVTGRIKDAILRNAETISAREVEEVVAGHPSVSDVAVVGLPDVRMGERVCAVVVPDRPDDPPTLDDLRRHCTQAGLSRHKHPDEVRIVEALPRNPSGKVLKTVLRSDLAAPAPTP